MQIKKFYFPYKIPRILKFKIFIVFIYFLNYKSIVHVLSKFKIIKHVTRFVVSYNTTYLL